MLIGNTSAGNKLPRETIDQIKTQIEHLKKKGDNKAQLRLISEVLDGDELGNAIQGSNIYLKNYMEGPAYFAPQGNRVLFWNKEQVVTKVLDYNSSNEVRCTYGHFSYEMI